MKGLHSETLNIQRDALIVLFHLLWNFLLFKLSFLFLLSLSCESSCQLFQARIYYIFESKHLFLAFFFISQRGNSVLFLPVG